MINQKRLVSSKSNDGFPEKDDKNSEFFENPFLEIQLKSLCDKYENFKAFLKSMTHKAYPRVLSDIFF